MKPFLIIILAFIFFLIIRIAKNQLTASQKIILTILAAGVLLFSNLNRLTIKDNLVSIFFVGILMLIFIWRLFAYLKNKKS